MSSIAETAETLWNTLVMMLGSGVSENATLTHLYLRSLCLALHHKEKVAFVCLRELLLSHGAKPDSARQEELAWSLHSLCWWGQTSGAHLVLPGSMCKIATLIQQMENIAFFDIFQRSNWRILKQTQLTSKQIIPLANLNFKSLVKARKGNM